MRKIYEDLMTLPGVSGNERIIRNYMVDFVKQYKNFDIQFDNLGSMFAIKKSKTKNAKTLMIAGHMDEVGFMVSNITKNGHIKLQALGGWMPEVLLSQVMNVYLDNGEIIKGIIGSLPPHLKQSNKTAITDLLLDIGTESKEETLELGVLPGNMVLFDNQFNFTANKKRVISKAIDNRYGCGLALEVIEKFNDIDLEVNLVVGATVQEEVGLRGARTSVNMFKPDMFIALDASPVNDLDKVENATLGAGFLLRIFDPRNVMHQGLMKFFRKVANENEIPYQDFTSMGGTDAAAALDQLNGVLATTIGLPARYIHSTAAMMDLRDLEAARNMIFKVVENTTNVEIDKIKEGYFD